MENTYTGSQLDFISIIKRDGFGTDPVTSDQVERLNSEEFNLSCLSISKSTYIAHGFNSYVVRIKKGKEIESKEDTWRRLIKKEFWPHMNLKDVPVHEKSLELSEKYFQMRCKVLKIKL